ncbi:DUF3667 domain-containing protein [Aquimarina sp. ERC-38]|uniref:DUF3667 domain-containing protein n=1 Tax=Aquimarina sp. ERC-38 TaxID=2949996 RepID=UPI002245A528|nr:DUF3667 domain-containing protein [Aquimarina sp. ERC-38]UZO80284.1 DUF3667 domain-containing protein [Aquimarina sp. ERC-38]
MELQPTIGESLEISEVKCKNCKNAIEESATFCHQCGAKFVDYRLTVRKITNDFLQDYIGWDNRYFQTFFTFLKSPGLVCQEFIAGVRKKYLSPFSFLAIGLTVSILVFNFFPNQYLTMQSSIFPESFYKITFDAKYAKTPELIGTPNYLKEYTEYKEQQIATMKSQNATVLKHFNLIAFLTIPMYTFIAFLVFGWKKLNYGEHLVINCYLQGFSMITMTLMFTLSPLLKVNGIYFNVPFLMIYYLVTYKQLLKLSWGKTFLKLLKFPIITVGVFLIIMIIGIIGTLLFKGTF